MGLIRAEHLIKTYHSGEVEVRAVKGVDFAIEARSFIVNASERWYACGVPNAGV